MCGQRCNEERAGDAQTTSEGVRQCTGVGEDIVGEIIRKEDPVTLYRKISSHSARHTWQRDIVLTLLMPQVCALIQNTQATQTHP